MDIKQAQLIEKYQDGYLNEEEVDEDDLLDQLDNDDSIMSQYREARIQQLTKEFKRIDNSIDSSTGQIADISDEKTLMDLVNKAEVCVVHFYQPHFDKCRKMSEKLQVCN